MRTPHRLTLGAMTTLGLLASLASAQDGARKHGEFIVTNQVTVNNVPAGARSVRVWLVLPRDDAAQRCWDLRVESPGKYSIHHDQAYGNRYLYVEVPAPAAGSFTVSSRYRVARDEVRTALPERGPRRREMDESLYALDLQPNTYVVINDQIRDLARTIIGDETDTVKAAHLLYDWVLNNIEYWVKDPERLKASPVGSTEYCLTTKTGNCTDFHSLYTSLTRSIGIPTRMVYGSLFKPELDGKDEDGSYHCWVEFYVRRLGWVPLDVALADLMETPAQQQYYFGNLDELRVAWTLGRDLTLAPPQAGGPVNSMPKAYVEIDGAPTTDWVRKFTYSTAVRD